MRKLRAVLIDDQEIVLNTLKVFLTIRNYEVLSYTRAAVCPIREGKGNFCSTDYPCTDVIITDFTLPGMNGLELLQEQLTHGCKLARENKAVMSASLDEECHKQIQQRGYAFFQKPVELSHLSVWLDECEKRVDLSAPLYSRRKETRHATHYEVRCLVDGTNDLVNGITINISDGGLCLELAAPLMERETVRIDTAHALIACRTASVEWVSRNQDGLYLAGLSCLH